MVVESAESVTVMSQSLSLWSLDRRLAGKGQKARAESVRQSVTGRLQRVQGTRNAIDQISLFGGDEYAPRADDRELLIPCDQRTSIGHNQCRPSRNLQFVD